MSAEQKLALFEAALHAFAPGTELEFTGDLPEDNDDTEARSA